MLFVVYKKGNTLIKKEIARQIDKYINNSIEIFHDIKFEYPE